MPRKRSSRRSASNISEIEAYIRERLHPSLPAFLDLVDDHFEKSSNDYRRWRDCPLVDANKRWLRALSFALKRV